MSHKPIELGLSAPLPSATPWNVVVAPIVDAASAWATGDDSPRGEDFRQRLTRLHARLVRLSPDEDPVPTLQRLLDICHAYFADTRAALNEREQELTSLVEVLRNTLLELAGQTEAFNGDLMRTSERMGSLAHIDDIRELKRRVAYEARELRTTIAERQRRDRALFAQLSTRVSALQLQLADAQQEADQDPLTKVSNRRVFDRVINEWSEDATRTRTSFAVVLLDVDDFKRINDTHGHTIGDRVLLCLAQRLTTDFRTEDVVARYGGEEFAVLLHNTSLDTAVRRISDTLERIALAAYTFRSEGREDSLTFSCSAGVAEYVPGESPEETVKRADRALYDAKKAGKNRALGRKKARLSFLPWQRNAAS